MPILNQNTLEFISRSPEQTKRIGSYLGTLLKTGDVICLQGELGAGKTTFVQGIVQGWGSNDVVTSPTFVLINEYHRTDPVEMHHLDSYRLKDAADTEVLDLDSMLENGILLVEWPDRIKSALPGENLWIEMNWVADEQRRLLFNPHGNRFQILVQKIRQSLFNDQS